MRTQAGQKVNYVDADGKIKVVTVIENINPSTARLDLSGDGMDTAIAAFNDDKETPNTYHRYDEPAAKPSGKNSAAPAAIKKDAPSGSAS